LKTNLGQNARGITLGITNMENWIDVVSLALKGEIRFVSLTHEGTDEKWFRWNDKGHKHDEYGEELRDVNDTNRVMVERGVTHLIIDTTKYTGT